MIQAIRRHEAAKRKRAQAGFTLIELLVVIIILGILAAVVVFAVQGAGDKGLANARAIDVRTIKTAQEAYCAQFGRYATADELVTGQFLVDYPAYHQTGPSAQGAPDSFGACPGVGSSPTPGADLSRASFMVTCDAAQSGCGAGGAKKPVWTAQGAVEPGLRDVDFIDYVNGRATGTGRIRRTAMGGTENPWVTEATPGGGNIQNIDCVDAETCWLVGLVAGGIWRKTAGNPWVKVPAPTSAPISTWRDVDFISPLVGVAVTFGVIVRTEDGGVTWTQVSSGPGGQAVKFIDADNVVAASNPAVPEPGPYNNVSTSSDAGRTWVTRSGPPLSTNIVDISFVGQEGWAVGFGGFSTSDNIFKTSDGGVTWQSLGTSTVGNGVFFVDSRNGWKVGRSPAQIEATVDGGRTWTVQLSGIAEGFGIDCLDIAHCWMATANQVYRYKPQ